MNDEVKLFSYTVTGSREFPLTALREGRCWPATDEDAITMQHSNINPKTMQGWKIRLIGLQEPKALLWSSVGATLSRD